MDGESLNVVDERMEQLKALLPEAFSEGKIDWEKLRLTLGEDLTISDERYVLNWAGKSEAFRVLQTPTTATLAPAKNESVNFEETENIFIEGENLEALKVLQKAYYGKIKMIYIDPPYNTGNDSFVYPDRFSESREEYLKRINDKDEEGMMMREGLFRKNNKDSGHYHSNWLSMMYPRLFLARNLLKDDGLIFVSIDDNEVHNLRLIMNDVFGEENFIAQICYVNNPKGRSQDKYVATNHEYCMIFSKSQLPKGAVSIPKTDKEIEKDYPRKDDDGPFRELELRNTHREFGKHNRPNLYYPIYVNDVGEILLEPQGDEVEVYPDWNDGFQGCWTWEKEKAKKDIDLLVSKKVNGNIKIYRKNYGKIKGKNVYKQMKSLWTDRRYHTEKGQLEFNVLFDTNEKIFQSPKSVDLLIDLMQMAHSKNEIVLDFFAGSGSFAHAVFLQNINDHGTRKVILIQLPEKIDPNDKDQKPAYAFCVDNNLPANIAEICKERMRRVIKKIKKERPMAKEKEQDLGFKVFKLKHSNFKLWRGDGIDNEEELEQQLDLLTDPVKTEAQEENMLFELLLKSGYPLTTQIEERKTRKAYYYLIDEELAIALTHLDDEIIKDVLENSPHQVICLDSLFADKDALKTNTQLQFKDAGIAFHSI